MDMSLIADTACRLDDLRAALAHGMTHKVNALVKAALIGGLSKSQLVETAGQVGPAAGREAVRRALEDWSWLEARRKFACREAHATLLDEVVL